MKRLITKGLIYGGIFAVVGVAGLVALKIGKNKNALKKAKDKSDGRKVYLVQGGTKLNPIQARTSNEAKDGKVFNNIIHEFDRYDKDKEIGQYVETIKDSKYKKWHKYIPTEPYTWMKIPYVVAYIEADKTILK